MRDRTVVHQDEYEFEEKVKCMSQDVVSNCQ